MLEHGEVKRVDTGQLSWTPSKFAADVHVKDVAVTDGWEMQIVRFAAGARFPSHTHQWPEFIFILEGHLVQGGRQLGPGWASISTAGTFDEDVHSEKGCVFVLVDRA